MSTLSMILAWAVCGIIALVGGGVVGVALSNLLNPKRRANNYVAWRVFTGKRGKGDVFIIKDAVITEKIRGLLNGCLFTTRGPGKGKRKKKEEANHENAL